MSEPKMLSFEDLFETSEVDKFFDFKHLMLKFIVMKNRELNFYESVLKTFEKLSEEKKFEYVYNLTVSNKILSSKITKKKDFDFIKKYIKLRCDIDYDYYNVGFENMSLTLDSCKSKQDLLDGLSKHLYGKFYKDYILFEIGTEILSNDKNDSWKHNLKDKKK